MPYVIKNEVYQHKMSLLLSGTSIKPSQMINGNNYTKAYLLF